VRVLALLLAVATACSVQHRVVVTGRELHRNIVQLRTQGSAEVEVIDYTHGHDPAHKRSVVRFDQQVLVGNKRVAISALAEHCKDVLPFAEDKASQADCGFVKHKDTGLELSRYESRSIRDAFHTALGWTLGLGFLGAVGFGIGCEVAPCTDGTQLEEAGDYALGGALAIVLAVIVWAIIDCMGKWGQPGCRD
jgi:hypothetical protein